MDIPDVSETERKLRGWLSNLWVLVPLAGMSVFGAAFVVYAALGARTEVLHDVLGLPPSFRALDGRALWLTVALAGLIGSFLTVGRALLTKEQLRNRGAALRSGAAVLAQWATMVDQDRAIDRDAIFVTDLTFKILGHAFAIDMMVDNRNHAPIRIMGVCVNWIAAGTGNQLLPHSICVLPSERPLFSGPTQVAGTFELTRVLNDLREPTRAYVSFSFTRHGTEWRHWANPVGANLKS